MKTTVNQGDTIAVLYYTYKSIPNAEYAEVYANWEDADKRRCNLLTDETVESIYIVGQTLW